MLQASPVYQLSRHARTGTHDDDHYNSVVPIEANEFSKPVHVEKQRRGARSRARQPAPPQLELDMLVAKALASRSKGQDSGTMKPAQSKNACKCGSGRTFKNCCAKLPHSDRLKK